MSRTLTDYWAASPFLRRVDPADWWKPEEADFSQPSKTENSEIPDRPRLLRPRLFGIEIPSALEHVADAIEKSRYILDLPSDWDEEGSPSYAHETWERAVKFMLQNVAELWRCERVRVQAPAIHHGPAASIDILWKTQSRDLLINVPPALNQPATYYGINQTTGIETKGNLDTSASNEWLLVWIAAK